MNTLRARDCIRHGWETFTKRPWFLAGATIAYLAVIIILDGITGAALSHDAAVLVNWIVQVLASMGFIALVLKAHDDLAHASIRDLWHPHPFWKYLGAYILLFVVVIFGFFLLIVPGIIWGIMFSFAAYIVIDRGYAPIAAFKESARITKGRRWMLFRLGILSLFIALLGLICFGIGIIVAMPVIQLSVVYAYRTLSSAPAADAPQPQAA